PRDFWRVGYSTMYLLDTNACIHILNNRSPVLVARLRSHDPGELCLCAVTKAELLFGAYNSARPAENLRVLRIFFAPYISLPPRRWRMMPRSLLPTHVSLGACST